MHRVNLGDDHVLRRLHRRPARAAPGVMLLGAIVAALGVMMQMQFGDAFSTSLTLAGPRRSATSAPVARVIR